MTFQETTKPLLRPAQAEEWREQASSLRQLLSAPPHIANRIEDRGQLTKNLRALEKDLNSQEPKPYETGDLDAAVQRADDLKTEIVQGMPTQQEMRRNPAGAVDKHRRWEKRNKPKIAEWKNIQLRMHQTGDGDLPDATDVANFERYRPSGGSQELNMDNEQIQGRIQHGPRPGAGPATVFTPDETDTLKAIDPEIHGRLALMDNNQRALVKQFMQSLGGDPNVPINVPVQGHGTVPLPSDVNVHAPIATPKRKSGMSPEARKAASERMKAHHAANRAAKEAAKNQEG